MTRRLYWLNWLLLLITFTSGMACGALLLDIIRKGAA